MGAQSLTLPPTLCHHPTMAADNDSPSRPTRKRVGHTKKTERAAVNAARAFLEDHECVVQEVDTGSDYGKDLLVDLTEDLEVTGESIAIQVKGGSSFCRAGKWGIPAKAADLRLWLESSTPIFGFIHDPATDELHWMNLSAYVREEMLAHREFRQIGRKKEKASDVLAGHFVQFPKNQVLTDATWEAFRESARGYLTRYVGQSLLGLLDDDPQKQVSAVADCFALGRGDARALLMVRQLVERLYGPAMRTAAKVLSHCVSHPDIFWHEGNWIPEHIRETVRGSFSWTPQEIFHMIREINTTDVPFEWERGTAGQCLFLILLKDKALTSKLPAAVRIACTANEVEVAVLILYVYQYQRAIDSATDKDLLDELLQIRAENPELVDDRLMHELIASILDHGWVDIF